MNNDERILSLEKDMDNMKQDIKDIKNNQTKTDETTRQNQLDIRDLINSNKSLSDNTEKLSDKVDKLCEIITQQQLQQLQESSKEKDKKLDRHTDFWIKIAISIFGGVAMIIIGALLASIMI